MRIHGKKVMFNLKHDIQVGDLSVTLICQVWTDDKLSYIDIGFTDIENIKYRGVSLEGYDDWKKFKSFHKEMGIDYDNILNLEFEKVFTKENLTTILLNLA